MHDLGDDSWETQPLDAVWTGPNAPPCSVEPEPDGDPTPMTYLLMEHARRADEAANNANNTGG